MTDVEYCRVYLRYGLVAHLLDPLKSPNSYAKAMCGRSPFWLDGWIGTGNRHELDIAAHLPTCKTCRRRTNDEPR